MKYLLLLTLVGCATAPKKRESDPEMTMEDVRRKLNQHDYFIDHDKCFISYAVCLGEKKKTDKQCWTTHENCVVSIYRQYKDVDK